MKKLKRVLFALCGLSLLCLAGCKKDADYVENAVQAKEVCDKSEMAGLKKAPASEEELVKVLDAAIKETDAYFESLNKERAVTNPNEEAKTAEEALTQIVDFVTELVNQVDVTVKGFFGDKKVDFEDEFALLGMLDNEIKFSFDKDINVGQIKVSEWIDVICDAVIKAQDAIAKEYEEFTGKKMELQFETKEAVKQAIFEGLDIDDITGEEAVKKADEYIKILDDFVVIKKFYLGTKVNVDLKLTEFLSSSSDFDIGNIFKKENAEEKTEEKSVVSADVSSEIAVALENVNKFVAAAMDQEEVNIPLKGVAVYGQFGAEVDLLNTDLSKWIGYFTNPKNTVPTINKANVSGSQQISMAICTAEGEGGYVTITTKEKAEAANILDLIEANYEDTGDKLEASLDKICDDIITVRVKVSNGRKTTFEQEYKYSEFKKAFGKYFEPDEIIVEE